MCSYYRRKVYNHHDVLQYLLNTKELNKNLKYYSFVFYAVKTSDGRLLRVQNDFQNCVFFYKMYFAWI